MSLASANPLYLQGFYYKIFLSRRTTWRQADHVMSEHLSHHNGGVIGDCHDSVMMTSHHCTRGSWHTKYHVLGLNCIFTRGIKGYRSDGSGGGILFYCQDRSCHRRGSFASVYLCMSALVSYQTNMMNNSSDRGG